MASDRTVGGLGTGLGLMLLGVIVAIGVQSWVTETGRFLGVAVFFYVVALVLGLAGLRVLWALPRIADGP